MTAKKPDKARNGRAFAAISPALVARLNSLAARATFLNDGYVITQRQVHDTLLRWAMDELGEHEAARLALIEAKQETTS